MNTERNCQLCGGVPEYSNYEIDRDTLAVQCIRCGRFKITNLALEALRPEQKPLLSAFCRRARQGNNFVTILSDNIEQLIASLPKYSPPEKLDNLLELMAEMTPRVGEYTQFDSDRDYPLLIAQNRDEVEYFTQELIRRGYLDGTMDGLALTMPAWERLEQIRKSGHASTRCFVAMWFDDSMREIYDQAIEPAIADAGYEALRIDRHEHVNRIDDEIIGQIRRSRFMVADFTGQRYGVYFEAGLMLGLGRPVIWMCRKEELSAGGGLHFDVRQFNFIAYESAAEARKRLRDRILAIEGEGPVLRGPA
ncbi:MAG: hypothetical protein LAN63_16240 [Acidobacteriia bacterium]|nr:hypothetical protein [Terriglobia bacterium]